MNPDELKWRWDQPRPSIRKPRPSSIVSSGLSAFSDRTEHEVPEHWQHLSPDACEVLSLFRHESLVTPSGFKRNMPPAYLVRPFSSSWFYAAERLRYSGPGRWFPRLLEFGKHPGETMLGIGNGLGTDLTQFARGKAKIVVCHPELEMLQLIRRNFKLRDLDVKTLHASWSALPLDSCSIDVVHIDGLLHEHEDRQRIVAEIYRVLKPGGKVVAVIPARPRRWMCWRNPRLMIHGLGKRDIKRLFYEDFIAHRRHRRHLRRREIWWGYRWLPLPWLERWFGKFWIIKAFKPVRDPHLEEIVEERRAA